MADNNFVDMPLTAITNTTIDVAATNPSTGLAINIQTGVDRLLDGQLLMLEKGSTTTLVQITGIDYSNRRITFANGDSLKLNQTSAAAGNVVALRAAAPPDTLSGGVIPTTATRVRMIQLLPRHDGHQSHPRLVRRINNGHQTTFNNTLGTAVAIDIENLQFTYDLLDGSTTRRTCASWRPTTRRRAPCNPNPCSQVQIRKINIVLTGRRQPAAGAEPRVPQHADLAGQPARHGLRRRVPGAVK